MHHMYFALNQYKCLPLGIAAREGHTHIVKLLLNCNRVDVNQVNSDEKRTALFSAVGNGRAAVVKLLLAQEGIEVNTAQPATPLSTACNFGHVDIVKLLLGQSRIDVNRPMTDAPDMAYTPLLIASAPESWQPVMMHSDAPPR